MSDLRKAADAAETALAELVKQGQADEAAFKEQIASPDGEITPDRTEIIPDRTEITRDLTLAFQPS